ncbi:MAG: CbrC family protein, partial [Ruminococcus sp.]|nr:CbrC family protein [Ruminococcus sp.]
MIFKEEKKMGDLPKFRYHPNIYDTDKVLDAVTFGENTCQCCGDKTEVYVTSMYCRERIEC